MNKSSKSRGFTTAVLNTNDRVRGTPRYRPVLGPSEEKVSDTTLTGQTVVSGGGITNLSALATGTSAAARIGNEIVWTSLSGRMSVVNTATSITADATNVCRVIFVYDKQANAAMPAVSDVLSLVRPDSTFQDNNKGRFIALKDYFFGVGFNSDVIKCFEVSVPLDLAGLYGVSSIPLTGSIFALYISDSTVLPAPIINFDIRLTYLDS